MHTEVTAHDLPVTGHIPDHLDGRFLRNGPNPAAEVDLAVYHWFSGDGMVHGVALRGGQARWYRNRSYDVATLDPDLMIAEMVFVPNPANGSESPAEDDGILMGYGYHRGCGGSQLLLLDAQSLESVVTVHLPQRVPMGFHGNWAPTG